ncbi:MAG: hypothetical protein L0214_12165, partial [candidate division NC10 bacterium]|nr:hypothetical protein [candidate division NC10 bacterium]
HRSGWSVWEAVLAFVVVLAPVGGGCGPDQARVTWTADGVQLTRLELPLDRAQTFMVGEYVLEGQEKSGAGARVFRDRLLLTTYFRAREGHVWGYGTRAYADGGTWPFGLSGKFEQARRTSEVIVVAGWAHSVEVDGVVTYPPTAQVELRLNHSSGRISVKAP